MEFVVVKIMPGEVIKKLPLITYNTTSTKLFVNLACQFFQPDPQSNSHEKIIGRYFTGNSLHCTYAFICADCF